MTYIAHLFFFINMLRKKNPKMRSKIIEHIMQSHVASNGSAPSEQHAAEVWSMMPSDVKENVITSIQERFQSSEGDGWLYRTGDDYDEKKVRAAKDELSIAKKKYKQLQGNASEDERTKKKMIVIQKMEFLLTELREKKAKFNQYRSGKTNGDVAIVDKEIQKLDAQLEKEEASLENREQGQQKHTRLQSDGQMKKALVKIGEVLKSDPLMSAFQECAEEVAVAWNSKRLRILENLAESELDASDEKVRGLQEWYRSTGTTTGLLAEATKNGIQSKIKWGDIKSELVPDVHLISESKQAIDKMRSFAKDYPAALITYYCHKFEKKDLRHLKYRQSIVDIRNINYASDHHHKQSNKLFMMETETHEHPIELFQEAEQSTLRFFTIPKKDTSDDTVFSYDCVELRDYLITNIGQHFDRHDEHDQVLDETYSKWKGKGIEFSEIEFSQLLDYIEHHPTEFQDIPNPAYIQDSVHADEFFHPTMIYNALRYFTMWQKHHCELRHGVVDIALLKEFDDVHPSLGEFGEDDHMSGLYNIMKDLTTSVWSGEWGKKFTEWFTWAISNKFAGGMACVAGVACLGSVVSAGVASAAAAMTTVLASIGPVLLITALSAIGFALYYIYAYFSGMSSEEKQGWKEYIYEKVNASIDFMKALVSWCIHKLGSLLNVTSAYLKGVVDKIISKLEGIPMPSLMKLIGKWTKGIAFLATNVEKARLYISEIEFLKVFFDFIEGALENLRGLVQATKFIVQRDFGYIALGVMPSMTANIVGHTLKHTSRINDGSVTHATGNYGTDLGEQVGGSLGGVIGNKLVNKLGYGKQQYYPSGRTAQIILILTSIQVISDIWCEWQINQGKKTKQSCEAYSEEFKQMLVGAGYIQTVVNLLWALRHGGMGALGGGMALTTLFCPQLYNDLLSFLPEDMRESIKKKVAIGNKKTSSEPKVLTPGDTLRWTWDPSDDTCSSVPVVGPDKAALRKERMRGHNNKYSMSSY